MVTMASTTRPKTTRERRKRTLSPFDDVAELSARKRCSLSKEGNQTVKVPLLAELSVALEKCDKDIIAIRHKRKTSEHDDVVKVHEDTAFEMSASKRQSRQTVTSLHDNDFNDKDDLLKKDLVESERDDEIDSKAAPVRRGRPKKSFDFESVMEDASINNYDKHSKTVSKHACASKGEKCHETKSISIQEESTLSEKESEKELKATLARRGRSKCGDNNNETSCTDENDASFSNSPRKDKKVTESNTRAGPNKSTNDTRNTALTDTNSESTSDGENVSPQKTASVSIGGSALSETEPNMEPVPKLMSAKRGRGGPRKSIDHTKSPSNTDIISETDCSTTTLTNLHVELSLSETEQDDDSIHTGMTRKRGRPKKSTSSMKSHLNMTPTKMMSLSNLKTTETESEPNDESVTDVASAKRGRGRPRKSTSPTKSQSNTSTSTTQKKMMSLSNFETTETESEPNDESVTDVASAKRGRGRPRKSTSPTKSQSNTSTSTTQKKMMSLSNFETTETESEPNDESVTDVASAKRGRGRPRKSTSPTKSQSNTSTSTTQKKMMSLSNFETTETESEPNDESVTDVASAKRGQGRPKKSTSPTKSQSNTSTTQKKMVSLSNLGTTETESETEVNDELPNVASNERGIPEKSTYQTKSEMNIINSKAETQAKPQESIPEKSVQSEPDSDSDNVCEPSVTPCKTKRERPIVNDIMFQKVQPTRSSLADKDQGKTEGRSLVQGVDSNEGVVKTTTAKLHETKNGEPISNSAEIGQTSNTNSISNISNTSLKGNAVHGNHVDAEATDSTSDQTETYLDNEHTSFLKSTTRVKPKILFEKNSVERMCDSYVSGDKNVSIAKSSEKEKISKDISQKQIRKNVPLVSEGSKEQAMQSSQSEVYPAPASTESSQKSKERLQLSESVSQKSHPSCSKGTSCRSGTEMDNKAIDELLKEAGFEDGMPVHSSKGAIPRKRRSLSPADMSISPIQPKLSRPPKSRRRSSFIVGRKSKGVVGLPSSELCKTIPKDLPEGERLARLQQLLIRRTLQKMEAELTENDEGFAQFKFDTLEKTETLTEIMRKEGTFKEACSPSNRLLPNPINIKNMKRVEQYETHINRLMEESDSWDALLKKREDLTREAKALYQKQACSVQMEHPPTLSNGERTLLNGKPDNKKILEDSVTMYGFAELIDLHDELRREGAQPTEPESWEMPGQDQSSCPHIIMSNSNTSLVMDFQHLSRDTWLPYRDN